MRELPKLVFSSTLKGPLKWNNTQVIAGGIVVLQGTSAVAAITCSSGDPDPKDPGGYQTVVEDLGPWKTSAFLLSIPPPPHQCRDQVHQAEHCHAEEEQR